MNDKFYKVLSKNDVGETHSHQSGIRIPYPIAKETGIFPQLSPELLNPRSEVVFYDEEGTMYTFQYIWYNDELHNKDRKRGHNEFRLTCVNVYLNKVKAKSGDEVWFQIDENDVHHIGLRKASNDSANEDPFGESVIVISKGWKKEVTLKN